MPSRFLCILFLTLAPGCSPAETMTTDECASSRECGAGQVCIDSRCAAAPDAGTGCGAACECASDDACRATVPACVEAACVDGSCFFREQDARCGGGTCDIAAGCTGGSPDAGGDTSDGGSADDAGPGELDGGPADAGAVDAGPADGGVTADAGSLRQIGAACTSDAQCESIGTRPGVCLTMFDDRSLPGGYCSVGCDSLLMRTCDADSICVRPSLARSGNCLDRCSTDIECRTREGYRCTTPSGASERVCISTERTPTP